MKTVTRFAPSPTGYIHIGNVRSAIYPYLLARQTGGTFILRIEDTDQARFVPGATELIEDTLTWLGLEWDEGPVVGGPHAPYFQTERKKSYLDYAKKLLATGRAYADPTTPEEIDKNRNLCYNEKIPFLYRHFRPTNPPEWQLGMPLRFKTEPKSYHWHDEVMGDLKTGPEVLDDIILIKKDGLPTYNFAHIVDDAEMGVTHVMRGVEYLSSTPNYLALYEALNLTPPHLVSLPHILAPTGNKKLGKRDGAKSVTEYRADGILPEAILNYLACLGWNDGTEQEIYTKEELIEKFSLDRVQSSGARYDETKLLWLNGQWIRKIMTEQGTDALFARTTGFWPDVAKASKKAAENLSKTTDKLPKVLKKAEIYPTTDAYKKCVLEIIYDRLKTLSDLKTMTAYFFTEPEINLEMITKNKFLKKLPKTELIDLLKTSVKALSDLTDWSAESIQNTLNNLLKNTAKKPAELFSLIRLAVSFAPFSPALNLTLNVLGQNTSLIRLTTVIEKLENSTTKN